MEYAFDVAAAARLAQFMERVGKALPRPEQRASFATYMLGLLSDAERKSVEPIAARAAADPVETQRMHDRLLHFARESPWSDRRVRREAATYAIEAMKQRRELVTTWIVDDTGFVKQGRHSPGVQSQYTGSIGGVANCQIGVSLCVATRTQQVPVDFALYLPKEWADDPMRRKRARIPESIAFKTKIDLAIDMIRDARKDGLPGHVLLADAAYGDAASFRNAARDCGFDYAVGVRPQCPVWLLDDGARRMSEEPAQVQTIAKALQPIHFRRIAWRDGNKKLVGHFAFRRVIAAAKTEALGPLRSDPQWLIIERMNSGEVPFKFFLTTLPGSTMSRKEVVRILKERVKTEQMYEELKGELGLDHFEGRSFTGWHHHVSVAMCCYAFIVAERVRAFFPSGQARQRRSIKVAA
ncbi:MAG: IS701 family transposase [Labilithrix sp.]|nr:IS701 family transposase [Labilithrix sp.]